MKYIYGAKLKYTNGSFTGELPSGLDVPVLLEQTQDHWKPFTVFDFHFVLIVFENNISECADSSLLELLALTLHDLQQLWDALKIKYLNRRNTLK